MRIFVLSRFHKNQYYFSVLLLHQSVGGIVVSIAAFQAVDPGSIPGRRKIYFFCFIEGIIVKTES